jgi:4-amino-4-deoxy-L-arabinose transferase-like glycosyltransferase
VVWLGAAQERGMIAGAPRVDIDPWQRLWPAVVLLLLAAGYAFAAARRSWRLPKRAVPPVEVAVLAGLALSLLAVWLLRAFPSSSDEYATLFQAETFLRGRLWNPVLPAQDFLHFNHIFEKDGKWVSQYPPGWGALLALVQRLGLPAWSAAPLMGAGLVYAVHRLGVITGEAPAGRFAALLLAVSPFFIFNAGSFFSHVPAALFVILFCLAGRTYLDRPRVVPGLLAGAALGALGLVRTFDVVILLVPFGVAFLRHARRPHYLRLWAPVAGGLPFLALLLVYYEAITGNPLLPVTTWGYPLFRLGLRGSTEWGDVASPLLALLTALVHLVDLSDWTSPLLVVATPWALVRLWRRSQLGFHDLVFPALVVGFLFYPDIGGDQYGPRYWFDAYPLLVLSIARAALTLEGSRRALLNHLALAHATIALVGVGVIGYWMRVVADGRMDIYDVVARAELRQAVVIAGAWTGKVRAMTPDGLTRNGVDAAGEVIYVLDLRGRRGELKALFPGRKIYLYERPGDVLPGRVVALEAELTRP